MQLDRRPREGWLASWLAVTAPQNLDIGLTIGTWSLCDTFAEIKVFQKGVSQSVVILFKAQL